MSDFFAVFLGVLAGLILFVVTIDNCLPNPTAGRLDTLLQLGYKNAVLLESPTGGDCSYFRAISPAGGVTQGAVCDDGSVR